jgi:hypothetical protein
MLSLLLATRPLQATDRRDKIFALVGLASDVDESFVDYSKDIEDIVTELSHMFLSGKLESTTSPLGYLSYITRKKRRLAFVGRGMNTLLRAFSFRRAGRSVSIRTSLRDRQSNFTLRRRQGNLSHPIPSHHLTTPPQTLIIRGALIARISQTISSPPCISHQIPMHDVTLSTIALYIDWHTHSKALASLIDAYPTGESTYDTCWRTLICNRATALSQDIPASDASYQSWTRLCTAQHALMQGVETVERTHLWARGAFFALAAVSVASTFFFWPRLPKLKIFIPLLAPGTYTFLRDFSAEVRRLALVKLHAAYTQILGVHQQGQQEFESAFSQWCQGGSLRCLNMGIWGGCRVRRG